MPLKETIMLNMTTHQLPQREHKSTKIGVADLEPTVDHRIGMPKMFFNPTQAIKIIPMPIIL
jgi:hypothetical protein